MKPVLAMDEVSFSYPRGDGGVGGVSLRVERGEWIAVMGPNGGGKSTLLKLAVGLLQPARGSVARADAAYVAQDPQENIVGERVADDVAFGLAQRGMEPAVVEARSIQALEAVGMSWAKERPMDALSGGELQRVALAAALASGAELLALDEPTSHLPRADAEQFWRALRQGFSKERGGVLYATHDIAEARYADWLFVLVQGSVGAFGRPQDVLRRPRLLEAFGLEIHPLEGAASLCEALGMPMDWPASAESVVEAVCSLLPK